MSDGKIETPSKNTGTCSPMPKIATSVYAKDESEEP